MNNWWLIIILIALAFCGLSFLPLLFPSLIKDDTPRKYCQRSCMGRKWKQRFPSASDVNIRQFLNIFCVGAFGFTGESSLKFEPDDIILDVYKELYPPSILPTPDGLELESLAAHIEENYNVDFDEIWREDLTLGELFSICHPNQKLEPSSLDADG